MKKYLFILFSALISLQSTMAQQRTCHSHDYQNEQLGKDPDLARRVNELETFTNDFIRNRTNNPSARMADVITIPVVVHVLWRTAAENISDAQIQSQIAVLNADFRKLNSDISSVIPEFAGISADLELQFCLASVDPNGNPTTGIQRKQTTKTSWGTNDAMKKSGQGGFDPWNRDKYLNIWVCVLSGGTLGYATFPGGNAALDGVVITTTAFGTVGNVAAPFNKGRTATHEVGHWLNLRHIWGDDGTLCTGSDQVNDTPNQAGPTYGCNTTKSSCSSRDNTQNYMDYSDDACMMMFTEGQKARARALFATGGARAAIRTSNGCGTVAPVCAVPSNAAVSNIANTSASLSFTAAAANATSYRVEIKTAAASTWTSLGTTTATSLNITGLSTCTDYNARVISICSTGESAASNIATFKTTGCATPCNAPTGTAVSSIANTSATVTFAASANATSYRVERQTAGTSTWTNAGTATTTSRSITGLTACTDYTVRVIAICATGESVASATAAFKTTGCVSNPCATPTGLKAVKRTSNSVTISWNAVSGASSYNVRQRLQGGTAWNTVSVTSPTRIFTGLNTTRRYEYQVQTVCGSSTSDWSAIVTYNPSTGGAKESERVSEAQNTFTVYPNPARGSLNIEYTGAALQDARISLFDLSGREVYTEVYSLEDGTVRQISLTDLSQGMYFVKIQSGGTELPIQRVVVQ